MPMPPIDRPRQPVSPFRMVRALDDMGTGNRKDCGQRGLHVDHGRHWPVLALALARITRVVRAACIAARIAPERRCWPGWIKGLTGQPRRFYGRF